MQTTLFAVSMLIAVIGPVFAVAYLRPILVKILNELCGGEGGAEFWVRCAYVLAVCGTLLLVLLFGDFNQHADLVQTLRRAFTLVFIGMFLTVAIISRNVWRQVRDGLAEKKRAAAPPAPTAQPVML